MDAKLKEAVDTALAGEGVEGVVVSDRNGLCLASVGETRGLNAATVFSLSKRGGQLFGESSSSVTIDGDNAAYVIQSFDNVVIGVVKSH
jgi:hypothetical protein